MDYGLLAVQQRRRAHISAELAANLAPCLFAAIMGCVTTFWMQR